MQNNLFISTFSRWPNMVFMTSNRSTEPHTLYQYNNKKGHFFLRLSLSLSLFSQRRSLVAIHSGHRWAWSERCWPCRLTVLTHHHWIFCSGRFLNPRPSPLHHPVVTLFETPSQTNISGGTCHGWFPSNLQPILCKWDMKGKKITIRCWVKKNF